MEATKRPWEFDESGFNFKFELGHSVGTIQGGDLNEHLLTVWKNGDIGKDTAIANAHLIVTAVNLHEEMREALKALDPMFDNDSPLLRVYAAEIRAVRALLAKVKEG